MTVVIDASVAIKWVMPEEKSVAAVALQSSPELIAPGIWLTEAANGLWKYVMRGELDLPEAERRLDRLRWAPVVTSPVDDDIETLFSLPRIYRIRSMIVSTSRWALRKDTYVISADRRFVALAGRRKDLTGRIRPLA